MGTRPLEQEQPVQGFIPLKLLQVVGIALIALKVAHLAFSGIFMDEAYYFLWGQHPALSYYDHPPLNAWLLGVSSAIFGWSRWAIRVPVFLTFLADIYALDLISRHIAPRQWKATFWMTLVLFLCTPIYWVVTLMALPDHLLLTCCLFGIYFFLRFFSDRIKGGEGATLHLLLAGLFVGLAGLSKYNAAFLGIGVLLYAVLEDRQLLRQPRFYAAGLLALVMQTPVLIWNITEKYASFEFVLQTRHAPLRDALDGFVSWSGGILIFLSPFLIWPAIRFLTAKPGEIPGSGFARMTFALSSAGIFLLSFTTAVLFHWNLVAYAAMLPFLVYFIRPRWLFIAQMVYGGGFAVLLFINYSIAPVTNVMKWRDQASAWSYGWSDTASVVRAYEYQYHPDFIATSDYTTASLLAFSLQDPNVTSLSNRVDQFDYWFDPKAHAGQTALLYGDTWQGLTPAIKAMFKDVKELKRIRLFDRFGRRLVSQRLYLASGFNPGG